MTKKAGQGKCIKALTMLGVGISQTDFLLFWSTVKAREHPNGFKEITMSMLPKAIGGSVMSQLANSDINSLPQLNLNEIDTWWKDSSLFHQVLPFLTKQSQLTQFRFVQNSLTSEQTGQLLACLAQMPANDKLKELCLMGTCNFDSDESIEQLAQVIDKCQSLKRIDLNFQ